MLPREANRVADIHSHGIAFYIKNFSGYDGFVLELDHVEPDSIRPLARTK